MIFNGKLIVEDLYFNVNGWRAEYIERCMFGSVGGFQKSAIMNCL